MKQVNLLQYVAISNKNVHKLIHNMKNSLSLAVFRSSNITRGYTLISKLFINMKSFIAICLVIVLKRMYML